MLLARRLQGGTPKLEYEFGVGTATTGNYGLTTLTMTSGSNATGNNFYYLAAILTVDPSAVSLNQCRYDGVDLPSASCSLSSDTTDGEHNGIGSAFFDPIAESGSDADIYSLAISGGLVQNSSKLYYRFWGRPAEIIHKSTHSDDLTPGFSYTAEVGDIVIVMCTLRNTSGVIADMSDFTSDFDEDTGGSYKQSILAYSRVMDTAGTYTPEFTISGVAQQYTTHIWVIRATA